MNFTDPEVSINMKSIEVVNLVNRAPPESLPQSLQPVSSETSPIFEKCDRDIGKPSQVIPKRNISDEVATVQSTFKSEHPSCQLRSSVVSGNTFVKAMPSGIVRGDGGNREKDDNYAYFKTRSANLERHLSRLLSNPEERDDEVLDPEEPEIESLHARRFFDALQGPELEIIRIYGQWMLGGRRRLSEIANPTNYLAIVGNFVGALLGAATGWKEGAIFIFAVGLAHYMVLFVTLYQRLPTNETLPKELHPVVFLFVATPSVASVAWEKIRGEFDIFSKLVYFIALFLYTSLVVRLKFFRGFRFSFAWWAYTFPLTGAAVATIKYSNVVRHPFTQFLAVVLSIISTVIVFTLLLITISKARVPGALFPNDASIAITDKAEFAKNQKKCKGEEEYDAV